MAVPKEGRARSEVATQVHFARKGILTQEMEEVARDEGLAPDFVMEEVASGRMIIPSNVLHFHLKAIGIGLACRCKVNANIGTSSLKAVAQEEMEKLQVALRCGADTVMDLSAGERVEEIRRLLFGACTVPFGTVPIYEAAARGADLESLTADTMISIVEEHARQGVDFVTIHAGLLREHLPLTGRRLTGIVSRGGSILAQWMMYHDRENPYYERFDEILEICRRYDLTLSLGDGLRPGCLADASDEAQFAELSTIALLGRRCREAEVQVMIEGPGHIPFDQIEMNVRRQQEECDGIPFYVLGPVVTDISPGYDHIASAIGATMAAFCGASLLCYVTPSEHLGLPGVEEVREGVIAFKIAAHAADVARKRPGARERDDAISRARYDFSWEEVFRHSLDPEKARERFMKAAGESCTASSDYCTMCGPQFCAIRLTRQLREGNSSWGKGRR